jgi:hypothetical protein
MQHQAAFPFEIAVEDTTSLSFVRMVDWLIRNIGLEDKEWAIISSRFAYGREIVLAFKNEQDAIIFALKWV